MGADYAYDENGTLWPFFVFTLTTIITLPLGWGLLRGSSDNAVNFPRIKTSYQPKHADLVESQRSRERSKSRRAGLALIVILGLAIMAYTLYLIHITEVPEAKVWNPYDILGISESSDEKFIKKVYKKLSLKFHPDKVKPDTAKNETLEMLNEKYVEISKAYQALTDDDIRENYIRYGHPGGKQSMSIGIALPKTMISEGNGKYIVLLYFMLFGVMLPYFVGTWWYGTQAKSKEGVLMESANRMFRQYKNDVDEAGIITAVSCGKEFESALKGDKAESGLSKIESRIATEGVISQFASGIPPKEKEALDDLECGVRRKVLALLWAYLGRIDLDDPALEKAKFEVAPIAQSLIRSFNAITLAYGNAGPILSSYYTSQCLIQALPPKSLPLLQLPHFSPSIAKAVQGESKVPITVQQFMDMSDAKRRSLVVGSNGLSDEQYKTAMDVALQLPYFRVAKSFFKVSGERVIIPSSLVTLVVKGRIVPPGSQNVPAINEVDLEDVDPAEDDIDALLGRKKATTGKTADGKPITKEDKPEPPPLAFSPYFGREYSSRWHVFLTDSKQGKMAVPPFTFTQFENPIFEQDGKTPTFNMQAFRAQFQAPPQAGHYTFVMHCVCDSYVGFDTKMEVTLVVEEASKAAEMGGEDEISEPEEDSIAGIMSAAKGEAPAKPKKKVVVDEVESDEESGTDEDDGDTSDTNTDTEPEDN